MKRFWLFCAAVFLFAAAGCNCFQDCGEKESADSIISKMEQAVNLSGKDMKVDSAVLVYDSGLGKLNKSRVTLMLKGNDKLRLEVKRKDSMMVKAYNGKKGWEYVTGKALRDLKGDELHELEFQAAYLSPGTDYNKLFSKIEVAGTAKAAGVDCRKLVCIPREEYKSQKMIIMIDKKSYFVIKTIEQYDSNKKVIQIVTYFGDYENNNGIMVPNMMVSQINGKHLLESKLVSAKWNVNLKDSLFEKPEMLAKVK